MNRNQFKPRTAATLHALTESGATTRGAIEDAADTSTTTVANWFSGERIPDSHDLHLLALRLPLVGRPLLGVVTDGTSLCVNSGEACRPSGSLRDGLAKAIAEVEQTATLARTFERSMADHVLTNHEAAALIQLIDGVIDGANGLRALVVQHTSKRDS